MRGRNQVPHLAGAAAAASDGGSPMFDARKLLDQVIAGVQGQAAGLQRPGESLTDTAKRYLDQGAAATGPRGAGQGACGGRARRRRAGAAPRLQVGREHRRLGRADGRPRPRRRPRLQGVEPVSGRTRPGASTAPDRPEPPGAADGRARSIRMRRPAARASTRPTSSSP